MTAFNTQYAFLTASMAAFEADHDPDLMGASHAVDHGAGPALMGASHALDHGAGPALMGASHAMLWD